METSSATTLKPDATFLPVSSSIRVVTQPEGLVLLQIREGMFYRANHVGARIWQKLTTGSCISETVKQIAGEFGIPAATVAPDVFEFVLSLLDKGFLKPKENR